MNITPGDKLYWTTEGRNVRVKALHPADDDTRWVCRLLEPSERDSLDKGDEKVIKPKNLSTVPIDSTPAPVIDVVTTPVPETKKSKKELPAPPPRVATLLVGTSIVFCGETPVLIVSGANLTWSDVMCWNISMQSTVHLHRADLEPKDAVDATITELQKHIKIQATKRS